MKRMIVEPDGWPCTLEECPPGHFVIDGQLCFKTEYPAHELDPATKGLPGGKLRWIIGNRIEAYNSAGEFFCGGVEAEEERAALMVQPVAVRWEE